MVHGIDNSVLYSAVQLKSTFRYGRDEKPVYGTGFFVMNRHGAWSLVTNRHMLDAGYYQRDLFKFGLIDVEITAFTATDEEDPRDMPTIYATGVIEASKNEVKFDTNYLNDVGVIVNPKVAFDREDVRLPYFVNHHLIADNAWIEEKLTVCDFVAYPGFPPQHDRAGKRPIFRNGTVSSDPRSNYSSTPVSQGENIAYEALSVGGSSGSPVYALRKGMEGLDGFREAKLVGVNAGHLHDTVARQHMGISYFVKSSVILRLIDDIPAPESSATFPEGFITSI
ncbi:UNVERIFIED_ORG: hypothetical protein BDU10_2507 [Burkholderia sp. CF145]